MIMRKRVVSIEKGNGWPGYTVANPDMFSVIQRDYRDGEEDRVKPCYATLDYDYALEKATDHYFYLKRVAESFMSHPGYEEIIEWQGVDLGMSISRR